MLDVKKVRRDFPILSQKVNGRPLVYLDNAATSQKPRVVIEAISRYYEEYNSNVHRGIHALAEKATAEYEGAREKVARFIGAARPSEIVFTSGTTGGINLVAQSWGKAFLKSGQTVLLTVMEHHSNLLPWQLLSQQIGINLEFIHLTEEGYLEEPIEAIKRVKPKPLAFVHVSNAVGTINPVREMIQAAHEGGAKVLLDAAQSVPHLPVSVQNLEVDFLVFSGHKMGGPTGIGVLYAREEVLKEMPPFLGGGEMVKEVFLRESTYKDPPYKFEAGTPNVAGVIGLGAAVDYLTKLGMGNVHQHEEKITSLALEKLLNVKDLIIYGPKEASARGGLIAFNVGGIHPHDLATVLDQEGVAIRSGNHCTMPLHDRWEVAATARASFYLYNTEEEVTRLVEAIEGAKEVFKV